MKIVVFSTDGICCRLIEKALPHHTVTVVSSHLQCAKTQHHNLHFVRASFDSPISLESALKGQDAVITALSSHDLKNGEMIIQAMQKAGVGRFIAVTPQKTAKENFFSRLIRKEMSSVEWLMKKSGLKWTLVCASENGCNEVADVMLDELLSTDHFEKVVACAS